MKVRWANGTRRVRPGATWGQKEPETENLKILSKSSSEIEKTVSAWGFTAFGLRPHGSFGVAWGSFEDPLGVLWVPLGVIEGSFGSFEASWTPLGVPLGSSRGGPGGPQEAILELLEAQGSTLDAQATKKHSRHPKMTPKSVPKVPK